ncbi:snRNA-activating protein complex subunit 1b [Chanos chanos]|uniref:snRNA-activating protein complex subunit 1b n=1 Tax=Chanos chanos TaxID=29144 RepID=A0A6J2VBG5_CHACN|nr:snRNA-activating protein complex subunit 1 [Chanos chanos]
MDHFKRPLKTDIEEILSRFQDTASVRFEEFLTIWRGMNFPIIFNGKLEPYEKSTFSRLVFTTAAPYFFPPYTFQIRVGGLYLLYGLYHSQLATPKEKIWLALSDWEHVKRFQQDAADAQHYDVVYVLRKLLAEKAFYFTAMPKPLYFRVRRKQEESEQKMCEEFIDRPSRPQELISAEMLEELANVHEHYERLKMGISAASGQSSSDLALIRQNLAPRLRNAMLSFHSWQKNHMENENCNTAVERSTSERNSKVEESSRRAQLLASIKSKSYGQLVEASKSRRHRQAEMVTATSDAESTHRTSGFKRRALSLKERTKTRLMAQGNVKEEVLKMTRLWRLSAVEDERTEEKKKRKFAWKVESEA